MCMHVFQEDLHVNYIQKMTVCVYCQLKSIIIWSLSEMDTHQISHTAQHTNGSTRQKRYSVQGMNRAYGMNSLYSPLSRGYVGKKCLQKDEISFGSEAIKFH